MFQEANLIELIKENENQNTISAIGKIDFKSLEKMDINDLLYIFPLIERMVIEVYKLIPGAIVEVNSQGTIKTITQIIKDNEAIGIKKISEEVRKIVFFYYDDINSLRNILFHPKKETITIQYNKNDILFVIQSLLKTLNDMSKLYDIKILKKIEKL